MELEKKEAYNICAEQALLGTVLSHNETMHRITQIICVADFYEPVHRRIYEAILNIMLNGGTASPVTLKNYFDRDEALEDIGGAEYLARLTGFSMAIVNLEDYARLIVDLHQRRALDELCEDTLLQLHSQNTSSAVDVVSDMLSAATKIITTSANDNSKKIRDVFEEIYETLKTPEPPYKASTGLKVVDAGMSGGMQKGRVYAFLAPAKCGKTMMATTISNHLCDGGHKHLFVCAEMGSREITERMLGQRLGVPTKAFRERNNTKLITDVANQINGKHAVLPNVIFEDEPGIELERLKIVIEKHVHKNKIEGFILDYYQLVTGQERHQSQAQHLENVANWIHRVCKKRNIWCLLLVQANDEGKVLGSRGLDRACDQKYMIERPLDEQNDPVGSMMWLKMKLSRYTPLLYLGKEAAPTLRINNNGTHLEEI